MEPAELPEMKPLPEKRPPWALTGAKGRRQNIISSLYLGAEQLENFNLELQEKLALIKENEVRYETSYLDDAEIVVVGFGTAARVAQTAVKRLRDEGLPVGLFRPISLWPFPEEELTALARRTPAIRTFLVVEMNAGQMVHDVRQFVGHQIPVRFKGRMGGIVPLPEEFEEEIRLIFNELNSPTMYKEASNGRVALR